MEFELKKDAAPVGSARLGRIALLGGGVVFVAGALALGYGRAALGGAPAAASELRSDTLRHIQQFLSSPPISAAPRSKADTVLRYCDPGARPQQIPLSELRGNPFQKSRSQSPASDTAASADAERLTALAAVQSLRVQSILCGQRSRSCTINNIACVEGQTLNGLVIEKITASAVVVKSGPYRFELGLEK